MTTQTVADLVIDALRRSQIETLFCLPGVQNDSFFDALVDATDITPIVTRHEQGAAYMAMGAAQVSGRPAGFCVVPGPGMLNASAALTSAYWGFARVFGIIGGISSQQQGKDIGALHDLHDPTAILGQLTKHAASVTDADRASEVIQGAVDELHRGVPRPVTIEVPVDLWGRPAEGSITTPEVVPTAPQAADVARAAELLAEARCPLIIVGSGAYGASASIRDLAEQLQVPVTTRRQGHGVLPRSHPLFLPISAAYHLWPEVDVVLGVGTRMEWPLNMWGHDNALTVIQLNLDEAEVNRHGITDLGLVADADAGCLALLEAVREIDGEPRPRPSVDVAGHKAAFESDTQHLVPQREFTAAIRDVLPQDGVIVEDVTQIGFASHLFYEHVKPRTFLTSGAAGTLGAGTAVAIGAAAVSETPVVGVVGDGGFLFTATELATAAQYNIPCNIVLFNDGAYGNVRRIQKTRFGAERTIASTLENPDFRMFVESFGVRYWHTDSAVGLRPALTQAIEHPGPSVVEVTVDEMPDPWPFFVRPPNRGV